MFEYSQDDLHDKGSIHFKQCAFLNESDCMFTACSNWPGVYMTKESRVWTCLSSSLIFCFSECLLLDPLSCLKYSGLRKHSWGDGFLKNFQTIFYVSLCFPHLSLIMSLPSLWPCVCWGIKKCTSFIQKNTFFGKNCGYYRGYFSLFLGLLKSSINQTIWKGYNYSLAKLCMTYVHTYDVDMLPFKKFTIV